MRDKFRRKVSVFIQICKEEVSMLWIIVLCLIQIRKLNELFIFHIIFILISFQFFALIFIFIYFLVNFSDCLSVATELFICPIK